MTNVLIINKSNNPLPNYATKGSSGLDLYAFLDNEITIEPMQRVLIPTGIYIQLDENYEAQIRPRSGLACKHGITVLNTPGTIDSDYRGEIKICLINLGDKPFVIKNGDKIAQMIISEYVKVNLVVTDKLEETQRNSGGFGSTGI